MSTKVLILGVNGFIGNALTRQILDKTDWSVVGMDLDSHKLEGSLENPRFQFKKGDIIANTDWIDEQVQTSDVVLPLVAIANPAFYVSDPLKVFALDFEANLTTVKQCVKHKKRIIFPSTSEVYGMSTDAEFNEETSNLVLGPINKQRWIYSCAKQMMDRVIYAYGVHENLDYTLFRPFNWLGPKMDDVYSSEEGKSRAVIQFISNILYGRPIKLMDGGTQRRCFTYIEEGVDALIRMIENKDGKASGKIFNIGNPKNNYSIKEVAEMLLDVFKTFPSHAHLAEKAKLEIMDAADYFGASYQDVKSRVPSIKNAQEYLGWTPATDLRTILTQTLEYHLIENPQEIKI